MNLPIWALKSIVTRSFNAALISKELDERLPPKVLSDVVPPFGITLPFITRRVSMSQRLEASQKISLSDPFTQEEMNEELFRKIIRSDRVADWYHLIGSTLGLHWRNKSFEGKAAGRLVNVIGAENDVTLVIEQSAMGEKSVRFVDRKNLMSIHLPYYKPLAPRVGTVVVPRTLLEDGQVRDFLQNSDGLRTTVRIVP